MSPETEMIARLATFGGVLVVMMVLEQLLPRRRRVESPVRHYGRNLLLVVVDSVALRLVFQSMVPVGVALLAAERGWGLFNSIPEIPDIVTWVLALLVLDLAIYLQHLVFHRVPALWTLHRVHHTDLDFDTTTGLRFHPVEIILSAGYKVALVLALGIPAVCVIVFEVILNGMALFNHANLRLPGLVDAALRFLFVTPDMHRVHHSVDPKEHHSNYGFNLSLWDRLFRTYVPQPEHGHTGMEIGLAGERDPERLGLLDLLLLPFRKEPD